MNIKNILIKRLKQLSHDQDIIKIIERNLQLEKYKIIINTNTILDIQNVINSLSFSAICTLLKNRKILLIIDNNKLIDWEINSDIHIPALCLLNMKKQITYCYLIIDE
jgi:hypothetical protein